MQEEACCRIWDERPWNDALISRSWSMEVSRWDFPKQRKIQSRDPKEIWDDGL